MEKNLTLEIEHAKVERILLNFSSDISKHNKKDIVIFTSATIDYLFSAANSDDRYDFDSSFVGYETDMSGEIESKIRLKECIELQFSWKKIHNNVCILIHLDTYFIKGEQIHYGYSIPDSIVDYKDICKIEVKSFD